MLVYIVFGVDAEGFQEFLEVYSSEVSAEAEAERVRGECAHWSEVFVEEREVQ